MSMLDESLVELKVMGIALDTRTGTPIVVLNDLENRRALPIWIGTAEASAIIRQLEDIKSTRPMTHDLLVTLIDLLGYQLERVEVHDLNSDTYYASLILQPKKGTTGEPKTLDARPSDAIAVALRCNAPIYATPNVVSEGTISTDQERDEQETEAFKDFISNLKASDFKFDKDIESDQ
jgi:uncharacterized protein